MKTKVALVGGYGSTLDTTIIADAIELLPEIQEVDLDLIDLRLNRDFLTENLNYDVVILCYIFSLSQTEQKRDPLYEKIIKHDLSARVSPLHSPKNWRKRLLETNAKNILIFGFSPMSEVTGHYIEELTNYQLKTKKGPTGSIWWYQRTGDN